MKNVLALLELRNNNGVLYGASVVDVHDIHSFIVSVLDAQSFGKAFEFAGCDLHIDCVQHVDDGALCDEYELSDAHYSVRSVYDGFSLDKFSPEIRKKIEEFLYDVEK